MNPTRIVLEAVKGRLERSEIPRITNKSIHILPEGKVPATAGQDTLVISPTTMRATRPTEQPRILQLNFRVYLISRIRSTPNDRFGDISYTDDDSVAETHHRIVDAIVSFGMFTELVSALNSFLVESYLSEVEQVRYSATRNFVWHYTLLDPIHLYPSYFLTKASNNDTKIAGYKTFSSFASPYLNDNYNPLLCH